MEFVTVVYRKELAQLKLQARSFKRFCVPNSLSLVTIVVNDEENEAFCFNYVEREVLPEFGPLRNKIRVLASGAVIGSFPGIRGYLTQQVLKMTYSKVALGENYVVLDAKNFFIRDQEPFDFFDAAGRGVRLFETYAGYKAEIVEEYNAFLDVPAERRTSLLPAMMTPFPMRCSLARGAIDLVEKRAGTGFADAFFKLRRHSEFLLYVVALQAQGIPVGSVFEGSRSTNTTIWQCNDDGVAGIDWHVDLARQRRDVMFGLHSRCVPRMRDTQWVRFEAFLAELGLAEGTEAKFWREQP